jgi:hypothetical protein
MSLIVTDVTDMSRDVDILVTVPETVDILQYLRCPLCYNRMGQPVTFCDNGHNICSDCKGIVDKCPTCGAKFNGIRNINLESISQWCNFNCANLDLGCPDILPTELMADHLASCKYSKTTCPMNNVMSVVCPWEGRLKDVLFHCSESHQKYFAEGEIFMSSSTEDAANIILYNDEIFTYQKRFRDGNLYCAVKKACKSQTLYTVSFILNTVDGSERVVFAHIVSDLSANFDSLLNSGKFLKLNAKLVRRFISDGKLALQVMIMRANVRH